MANPQGGKIGPGPGRPKGSKDKIPRALKNRVMEVWDQLQKDGKDLYNEAVKDPKWFYQNFVKPMLPKDVVVQGDEGKPLVKEIVVKHVKADTGATGFQSRAVPGEESHG